MREGALKEATAIVESARTVQEEEASKDHALEEELEDEDLDDFS